MSVDTTLGFFKIQGSIDSSSFFNSNKFETIIFQESRNLKYARLPFLVTQNTK